MDDIPTSYYQYSLFSENRQFFPKFIVPSERLGIVQAHRDHWNIGTWKEVDKCRPDTMIESSPMISSKRIVTSLLFIFPSFLRRQESMLLFTK